MKEKVLRRGKRIGKEGGRKEKHSPCMPAPNTQPRRRRIKERARAVSENDRGSKEGKVEGEEGVDKCFNLLTFMRATRIKSAYRIRQAIITRRKERSEGEKKERRKSNSKEAQKKKVE